MPNILCMRDATDASLVGNKAARLARLAQAGFNVPAFFVVVTDTPDRESNGLPASIERALSQLGGEHESLAVRSSALEEDGKANSFAGQFESFLQVPPDNVAVRVTDVWQSADNARVKAYRNSQGLARHGRAPAVMVQRMLAPEAAGVAFAVDPVSQRRDVAVVAAARGLGDKLAGGEEQGSTWRVGEQGEILDANEEFAPRPVLNESQIRTVAELARAASCACEAPQDIEWALCGETLYLLQSRDITTIDASPADETALWDNSNIVESYGGVTTPLTFSIARTAYAGAYRYLSRMIGISESAIAANAATYEQMIGLIEGRVYYNLLNWYRLLMLTPGFRFNQRFMEQMMGVGDALPHSALPRPREKSPVGKVRATASLARVAWRLIGKLPFHRRAVAKFHRQLEHLLAPVPLQSMSLTELLDYHHRLENEVIPRWDTPLLNDLYCMIFHGALRWLTQRWLSSEHAELHNALLTGESNLISLEPVHRMRHLAELAQNDHEFVRLMTEAPLPAIHQRMQRHREFGEEFGAYLERFGDRCMDELKLESRTLADDPLPLLRSIGQMAATGLKDTNHSHASSWRHAAEATLAREFSGDRVRSLIYRSVLSLARARVRDRENLRFERTRVYGRVRALFVEVGRRLHRLGAIDRTGDVFYLDVQEIIGFARGTGASQSLAATVALRRREFDEYRHSANPPPRRFVTQGPPQLAQARQQFERKAGDGDPSCRQGQGCCAGIVRGPVKIVRNPDEARLRDGDILVAERTDPGWVTVFPLASGMIMERGSLLSHSAIVSRELGLPCVVGVQDACTWLRDGEWVELNGMTGSVRRLPPTTERAA